jgi:hypothetical protein
MHSSCNVVMRFLEFLKRSKGPTMAVICGMCQKCFYGTQRLVEHMDRSRDCRSNTKMQRESEIFLPISQIHFNFYRGSSSSLSEAETEIL